MKTLFLNPPSYEGFDGGAGSRYQATREIRSFWYPTWLAQPAAMVEGSRLIDAPARGLSLDDVLPLAGEYALLVIHTSTPSFASDARVAQAFKEKNPKLLIGFVGAHVAVLAEESLKEASAVDFVGRAEFDYTIKDVADGKPLADIAGLSYRKDGAIVHNKDRALIHNLDDLPFVSDVYARDLVPEDYFIGYLKHPYMSLYTGRGCKSRCTFCLWPQTIAGHVYRTRSPDNVAAEIARAKELMPNIREFFFDDDTFTDDAPRAIEIAKRLGKLGVTWSCNAKANVDYDTLKALRDNGLRLLLVGYESGNQQILHNIKKGMRIDVARRFTQDCHRLGIKIHGTFIVGLPGETQATIAETVQFAKDINPHTIQVSIAAPYPGTFLYNQARDEGWLSGGPSSLVQDNGFQITSLSYPHLSQADIFEAVAEFYKKFYFRPRKIADIVLEMAGSWDMTKRRLREGVEFFHFLNARAGAA